MIVHLEDTLQNQQKVWYAWKHAPYNLHIGCDGNIGHGISVPLLRYNEISIGERRPLCDYVFDSYCEPSASTNTKVVVDVSVTRAREVGCRRYRHRRTVADPCSYQSPRVKSDPRLSTTTRRITATQSGIALYSLLGTIRGRRLADQSLIFSSHACVNHSTTRDFARHGVYRTARHCCLTCQYQDYGIRFYIK